MLNQHKAPSFTSTGQPPRSPHVPMGGMGLTPTVPQTLSAHSWSMAGAEASRQLTVCPLQLQHAPPGHTWGAVAPGWAGTRRLCSILHQTDMTTAIPGGPEQHCQEAKYLLGLWDSSNAHLFSPLPKQETSNMFKPWTLARVRGTSTVQQELDTSEKKT